MFFFLFISFVCRPEVEYDGSDPSGGGHAWKMVNKLNGEGDYKGAEIMQSGFVEKKCLLFIFFVKFCCCCFFFNIFSIWSFN